jgi:hypothetical protein
LRASATGEAAIQRTKAPRVYYYQEPSASTAKWGDKVVNLADGSGASSSSSSSAASSSSSAPRPHSASEPPIPVTNGVSSGPQQPVAMPNIQPTAPAARRESTTGLAPAMGRLSVASAQPVSTDGLSRSVDGQRAPSPQPFVDPFGGSNMGSMGAEDNAADVSEFESAIEEMVEALSNLALGAMSVPFGDQEVLLLNSSLKTFSSGLRALKRSGQQLGGEADVSAQRAIQNVSGLSLLLRQINGDPGALSSPHVRALCAMTDAVLLLLDAGAITPYKNLGDMAKRGTFAVSNIQFALVHQVGAETAAAVQETAVATKALLQAALQPTSDIALLKSSRLAAANAINVRRCLCVCACACIRLCVRARARWGGQRADSTPLCAQRQLMREVYRTMLRMGNTQGQEQLGEAGWTIGRIMEALIISAKTAYSNPQDQVMTFLLALRATHGCLKLSLSLSLFRSSGRTKQPRRPCSGSRGTVSQACHSLRYSPAPCHLSISQRSTHQSCLA